MPEEAISLALAASIYPPALAAVIALGRGTEVRLRVALFVAAAYLTVLVTGAAMLLLFADLEVGRDALLSPDAALYVLAGVALLLAAARLRRRSRPAPPQRQPAERPSRTARYLQSRKGVALLGVALYVVPSPIFVAAVHAISVTDAPRGEQLVYLVVMLLIMLWLIELPMLMLLALPAPSLRVLEAINAWFAARWRGLLVLACAGLGAYLLLVGVAGLAP